jgi:hypothetical protein
LLKKNGSLAATWQGNLVKQRGKQGKWKQAYGSYVSVPALAICQLQLSFDGVKVGDSFGRFKPS